MALAGLLAQMKIGLGPEKLKLGALLQFVVLPCIQPDLETWETLSQLRVDDL